MPYPQDGQRDSGDSYSEESTAAARLRAMRAHERARQAHERAQNAYADELTVRTTSGWVRGVIEEDLRVDRPISAGPVRTWRGIPFGASTAGDNRFRAPRPAPRARRRAGTGCAIAANSGQLPHNPRTPGLTASSAPRTACT